MMNEKSITVFTPTYNRAYCLHILYESLCAQSSNDFKWLIIDDGSTDNTLELVQSWISEGKVEIEYSYKENGGMHTGHNKAYELINTRLNVCIDSDDCMPSDAVEKILLNAHDLPENCYGIIGLDEDKNGKIIGSKLPADRPFVKLSHIYTLLGVTGDKKLVIRTEFLKGLPPYPTFQNERFVPLDYLYLLLDQRYDLKVVNEVFCTVDYQQDGSTMNMSSQYRKNPNGFAFSRVSRIQLGVTFKERFKNAIHLVSSAIFSKDLAWIFKPKKPVLMVIALPFGLLLNLYVRYKTRH